MGSGLRRQSFRQVELGGEMKGKKVTASGRKATRQASVAAPIGCVRESLLRRFGACMALPSSEHLWHPFPSGGSLKACASQPALFVLTQCTRFFGLTTAGVWSGLVRTTLLAVVALGHAGLSSRQVKGLCAGHIVRASPLQSGGKSEMSGDI